MSISGAMRRSKQVKETIKGEYMANFSKKNIEPQRSETFTGNTQDLLRERAKQVDKITKKAEEMFEDYSGGGLVIVMNEHDENNEITGCRVFHAGVERMEGLFTLAQATDNIATEIMDELSVKLDKATNGAMKEASDTIASLLEVFKKLTEETDKDNDKKN